MSRFPSDGATRFARVALPQRGEGWECVGVRFEGLLEEVELTGKASKRAIFRYLLKSSVTSKRMPWREKGVGSKWGGLLHGRETFWSSFTWADFLHFLFFKQMD